MKRKIIILLTLCILLTACAKGKYTCPDGTITDDLSACGQDCKLEKAQADNEQCDFRDYRYTMEQTPLRYDNITKSYVIDKVTIHNEEYTDGGFRVLTSFYENGKELDYGFSPEYIEIKAGSDYVMEDIRWPTEQGDKDIKVKVVQAQQTRACSTDLKYEDKVVCG